MVFPLNREKSPKIPLNQKKTWPHLLPRDDCRPPPLRPAEHCPSSQPTSVIVILGQDRSHNVQSSQRQGLNMSFFGVKTFSHVNGNIYQWNKSLSIDTTTPRQDRSHNVQSSQRQGLNGSFYEVKTFSHSCSNHVNGNSDQWNKSLIDTTTPRPLPKPLHIWIQVEQR